MKKVAKREWKCGTSKWKGGTSGWAERKKSRGIRQGDDRVDATVFPLQPWGERAGLDEGGVNGERTSGGDVPGGEGPVTESRRSPQRGT